MNRILQLIQKNIKNLVRAKTSALVIILGPLLIIFLAGLAFDNSNVYAVKIGTYIPTENEQTQQITKQLSTQYNVLKFNTQEECVENIKNADINTCLVFPQDFSIGDPLRNNITFFVDYSKVNLVWTIRSAMSSEVGEQTLAASENYTRELLTTIDFTQERINDQRKRLVSLTTENELMRQNTLDLIADLGDIDLSLNEQDFPIEELAKSNTQVKQWVDNALTKSTQGLSKATSFIDAADAIVRQSAVSTESKTNLLAAFKKSVDDIKAIEADLIQTKNLTLGSFNTFEQRLENLSLNLQVTKERLGEADASRDTSIRVLEAVTHLLDQSLLSIASVQSAINDIDHKINQLSIRDAEGITQPIRTIIKPIAQEKTYLNYLFPVLIVLVIMFTALLLTSTLVMMDKNSPALFRTYMTPTNETDFVIATWLTSVFVLLMQTIVILAIASIFYPGLISHAPLALIILIFASALFAFIGQTIGYIFSSEETATLGAVSLGALMLFISDVIIPIESMPEIISYIARFNPFVLASSLVRRTILFEQGFLSIAPDLAILVGYVISMGIICFGVYYMTKHYTFQQFTKQFAPVFSKLPFRKKRL
jgi:ABC-2 type transport system permease protein